MDALGEAKPGQAFNLLKRLGTRPGDCSNNGSFSLPNHESESLSDQESAEKMAEYFASISGEYPPLSIRGEYFTLFPNKIFGKSFPFWVFWVFWVRVSSF